MFLGLESRKKIGLLISTAASIAVLYYACAIDVALAEGKNKKYNTEEEIQQPSTKVIWLRCPIGKTWNGSACGGEATEFKWKEAQKACKKKKYRLPTANEYEALLGNCKSQEAGGSACASCAEPDQFRKQSKYYRGYSQTCSGMFGEDRGWYWSSSSFKDRFRPNQKFKIAAHFVSGSVQHYDPNGITKQARCVRNGVLKD